MTSILGMEVIGPHYRMKTGIFMQSWFALGIMSVSGIAWFVRDSKTLQIILSGVTLCLLSLL